MRPKPRRVKFPIHNLREAHPLRIVGDALIATRNVGGGRPIPLVILDTTDRPDLEELIRVHQYLPAGDIDCGWGELEGSKGMVALILTFKRPSELIAILEFDIVKQGVIVDQILTARGLYIQSVRDGDRYIKNPDAPRILAEIPDTGFHEFWNRLFHCPACGRLWRTWSPGFQKLHQGAGLQHLMPIDHQRKFAA